MITIPVEANATYIVEFAARCGIQVTPWQRLLLGRWFPSPPALRHRPRPLPIDGNAYRARSRNRRKK